MKASLARLFPSTVSTLLGSTLTLSTTNSSSYLLTASTFVMCATNYTATRFWRLMFSSVFAMPTLASSASDGFFRFGATTSIRTIQYYAVYYYSTYIYILLSLGKGRQGDTSGIGGSCFKYTESRQKQENTCICISIPSHAPCIIQDQIANRQHRSSHSYALYLVLSDK